MTYGVQLVSALHVSDVENALRSQRKVALKNLRSTFVRNVYSAVYVIKSCHFRNTINGSKNELKRMGISRRDTRVLRAGPRRLVKIAGKNDHMNNTTDEIINYRSDVGCASFHTAAVVANKQLS